MNNIIIAVVVILLGLTTLHAKPTENSPKKDFGSKFYCLKCTSAFKYDLFVF